MAENEYLDSTKARRWLSVADAIRDRCDLDVLTDRVKGQFYKTLQKISQDIPLSELIGLVDDPARLSQRSEQIEGASDVKGFLIDAARSNDNQADALNQFLNDAFGNCIYDIPYLAAVRGDDVNVSDARRRMEEVRSRLIPDLRRIAEKWAENPSWKPRKLRDRSVDKVPLDNTKIMLGESLIAGFRK